MANTKKIQLCSEKGQEKGMKKIELSSLEGCILDDNYTIVVIDGKKYVDIDKVTEFIFKEDEDKLPVKVKSMTPINKGIENNVNGFNPEGTIGAGSAKDGIKYNFLRFITEYGEPTERYDTIDIITHEIASIVNENKTPNFNKDKLTDNDIKFIKETVPNLKSKSNQRVGSNNGNIEPDGILVLYGIIKDSYEILLKNWIKSPHFDDYAKSLKQKYELHLSLKYAKEASSS